MTNKQQQCYDKAMKAFSNVFQMLCNANGPLPSPDEQSKVLKISVVIINISAFLLIVVSPVRRPTVEICSVL